MSDDPAPKTFTNKIEAIAYWYNQGLDKHFGHPPIFDSLNGKVVLWTVENGSEELLTEE